MTLQINQRGFGVIEVVGVIVILGLIGGGGYYVYQNQKDDSPKAQSTTIHTQKQSATPSRTEAKPQTEDEKILAAVGCKTSDKDCVIADRAESAVGDAERYALVKIGGDEGGTTAFVVEQKDGSWKAVYKGNGDVPASVTDQHDFPDEWLGPSI